MMILHSGLLFWATLYSMEHQFFMLQASDLASLQHS